MLGKNAVMVDHDLPIPIQLPSPAIHQLNDGNADPVPGFPRIQNHDQMAILRFLEQDLYPTDLERMAPKLWWMSKQDGANISPLHRQRVKGRQIIITENPKLHLVWIHDRIFIKPLPLYMLSSEFWEKYLIGRTFPFLRLQQQQQQQQQDRIRRAALGLLRTYFYLIQHESDFRIAQNTNCCLIPSCLTWRQFCEFSSEFGNILDAHVTERYKYEEIRLTRLNLYSKVLLRRWHFQQMNAQYGAYFAQFYAPILFILGGLSVMLSAMQVELSVEQIDPSTPQLAFRDASRWFSVVSLISLLALAIALVSLLLYKIIKEWRYALKDQARNRKGSC